MSETQWTREQWDAINEKDCNLLVAATAGAGKTAVLVERIIQKITDVEEPIDIDRMLIVTFTNAAATEMRERIHEAVSRKLEEAPDSRNVQRQLTLLGKASITTLHSFCLEVIRSNFHKIDIDPDFRVADATEGLLMKLEALSDVFEEQYEEEDSTAFIDLLECYGGNRDDQVLQEMVLNLYDFIQSSPWPMDWLEKMTQYLDVPEGTDFGQTIWGRVLLNSIYLELKGLKEMIARAVEILMDAPGLEKYLDVYTEDLEHIHSLETLICSIPIQKNLGEKPHHVSIWDMLFNTLQDLEFRKLPRCGKEIDRDQQALVKRIRDEVKAGIKTLREKIVVSDSSQLVEELVGVYPKMKCLADLAIRLSVKYTERKRRRALADFNDLEHFCLEILSDKGKDGELTPSETALTYREKYAEILVDEYQDSNLVQEIIINMISKKESDTPNVFMVGDVKQSIYRFRQARPELFLEKYNTYSSEAGSPFRKILLYKNFRSRTEVVNAVNFVFKQIMSKNAGELDYTEEEALNPGAVFEKNNRADRVVGGEVEFHLLQTGNDRSITEDNDERDGDGSNNDKQDGEILDNIQCEARLIGQRILDLITPDAEGRQFNIYDRARKMYRPVEFRDMVILLRTTKNWAEVFTEELTMMGVPAFADTGTGFFKTVEIQVVLSLLNIIDNPLQDIPLLSVLRSPIVSFNTDELAELRLVERKVPLYDALLKLAEEGQGETAKKAAAFLSTLQKWREMALYLSTDRLLWQLYTETGYYDRVRAMPSGEQRQANLRILFERARQFEETSYKGLFNFIHFIEKLKSSKGDMGSAKILGENDNVVRIMSIHKSKGLEFPVVILAGCGKKFNLQDMNKSILLHQELGFGPDVVDHKLRISWPSAAKQAIRIKMKTETLSEEMRILYVAMTRAREKLIITGGVRDIDRAVTKWLQQASCLESGLPDYEMLKGGTYLGWIGPAVIRHKSCGGLRDSVGSGNLFHGLLIDDPSVWRIQMWNKDDIPTGTLSQPEEESEFIRWLDSVELSEPRVSLSEEISRRLDWNYKYKGVAGIPAKVSVTELKRRFNAALSQETETYPEYLPPLIKKPLFLETKKGLTHAERGTVLHFVMQHLNFNNKNVNEQITQMITRDLLTPEQARSVDVNKILCFLESPLGKRMAAAKRLYREVPFHIEIPCCELYPDMTDCTGETLLLQGVIDCYFEEPDGIVLVDYKTDYVPAGKEDMIRKRYHIQIGYYVRALEMLTGKRVEEKYIYLFHHGHVLEI